ncbi:hypothetical protein MIND_00123000 [Mycena indigotica]|uniref:Chromatin elongation factor SPT5 n=1 Tax=Mycena indigotica TaxID=2126181 RepID=A0A8H6WIE8_9AGAR|nr:uncharacterized protein MIND_00123000 [Mycena indigotica]KAF7316053.1 hypothetical protein MIND_00123000 [Mycena indigotica]
MSTPAKDRAPRKITATRRGLPVPTLTRASDVKEANHDQAPLAMASEMATEEGSPRKKQKRTSSRGAGSARQYLDLAAVSDDGDDSEYDQDDDAGTDDFIEDTEGELDSNQYRSMLDGVTRKVHWQDKEDEKSAEQLAKEIEERYKAQRAALQSTGEGYSVPQRLLIPSINDPALWKVSVKPGKERELVFRLLRKAIDLAATSTPLPILSVFARDAIQGSIYIEARRAEYISFACDGLVGVYHARPGAVQLVAIEERAALLQLKPRETTDLAKGNWVRFKRKGTYQGDLAQVVEVFEPGEFIKVRFVPRIDLQVGDYDAGAKKDNEDDVASTRRKAKSFMGWAGTNKIRPPQKLFNDQEVQKVYGARSVQKRNQAFLFEGEIFIDGFVEKEVKRLHLIWVDVTPTVEEFMYFKGTGDTTLDLSGVKQLAKKTSGTVALQPGDRVQVIEGEQAGVYGHVAQFQKEIVTVHVRDEEMIEVSLGAVRKIFKAGDHVKIIDGQGRGETGLVVSVGAVSDMVTLVSDMTLEEITVRSEAIQVSPEVGTGANHAGSYKMHQLVELNSQLEGVIFNIQGNTLQILDVNDDIRQLQSQHVSFAIFPDERFGSGMRDADGQRIQVGELMKELALPGRRGRVIGAISRVAQVFLYDPQLQNKTNGVFTARPKTLVAQSQGDIDSAGHMIGDFRHGPGYLAGANVIIVKGRWKGYWGIIKHTQGTTARVEVQATLSSGYPGDVTVEQTSLKLRLENGRLAELSTFRPPRTLRRLIDDSPTDTTAQKTASNSIPVGQRNATGWASPLAGSSSPAQWGQTTSPRWDNGSKTPYVGGGNSTPAWSPTSQVPGANTSVWGGQTPAWTAPPPATAASPIPKGPSSFDTNPWGGKSPAWAAEAFAPPATAPTFSPNVVQTPQDDGWSWGLPSSEAFSPSVFAALTPVAINTVPYDPPKDWLLDSAFASCRPRIMVRICGTKNASPPYLEGIYENKVSQIVTAARVATEFAQTAMLQFEDGTKRAGFPVEYLLPLAPKFTEDEALVIDGPMKGMIVRLREDSTEAEKVLVTPFEGSGVVEIELDKLTLLGEMKMVEIEEGEIVD